MIHTFSAGVGERMQYIAHKYNDTTIRFILKYPGHPDAQVLCRAVRAVIESVDVLHASFIAKTNSAHWRINEEYGISDYFALMECDGDPVKPAKSIALQPVEHRAKCQMHVTQVCGSDSCAVVVRISHLVADGSDGKYLLSKLAESYRLMAQTGGADGLNVKNGSRSAMCAYNELSGRELVSLLKKPLNGVKTEYPFQSPKEQGLRRMLHCTILAPVLSEAHRKAKLQGATVNDVLLTACHRSFAKAASRKEPVSISVMMDLRKHCRDGVSEGLANMSGGFSTTLDASEGSSFSKDLAIISGQTKAAKDDPLSGLYGIPLLHTATRTLPMWLLLQAADIVYSSMSLSFTNLGSISCEPLSMNGLVPVMGIFAGPLKKKPSVQVAAASFGGAAELAIVGEFTWEDEASLQAFLNGICEEIGMYVKEREG